MKISCSFLLPLFVPILACAQTGGNTMPGMTMPAEKPAATAPAATGTPPHQLYGWAPPVDDRMRFNYVLLDRLEFSTGASPDALHLDAQGWYGGDRDKFWWKAEGTHQTQGASAGEGELQALYSQLVAPFWDFQAGLRYDRTWGPGPDHGRAFAVFGFTGLAPYWFEVEPALFVSEDGDVSARLSATYDALLSQRLVLQPRLDVNVALQEVPKFGIGSGFNNMELGLRLRYEIKREFAPYVGVTLSRQLGATADLARGTGVKVDEVRLVAGVRLWW
jgi:copper resistance protein B